MTERRPRCVSSRASAVLASNGRETMLALAAKLVGFNDESCRLN